MKAVLFVDDNAVLSRLSCDILQRAGYRAVPAYSGPEALERLEREHFDVLVTDFRMEGMNGLELARAIHGRNPRLPVIVVTAYGPVQAKDIYTCLAKDGLFPSLLEQIRLCLAEAEPQG
jgi:CheY-like chemotaxis protein